MKITTEQRNRIVEQNLWCVDAIIRQNEPLIRAAYLEYDDVYQELSMRLICAVSQYVPQKGNMRTYICSQLRRELWACTAVNRRYGLHDAPNSLGNAVISLDEMLEMFYECEMAVAL